jgi:hypothetical protein
MFVDKRVMKNLAIIILAVTLNFTEVIAQNKALLVRTNGSTRWGNIYLKKGNKLLYRIIHGDNVKKGRIKEITDTSFVLRGGEEVLIKELQMVKFMFPLEKALGYGFGGPIFALGLSYIVYPLYDANTSKEPAGFLRTAAQVIIGTGLIAASTILIFQKHRFDMRDRWRIVVVSKKKDKS